MPINIGSALISKLGSTESRIPLALKDIFNTAGYTYSQAYKTLYKKGKVVSSTVISRDTYKNH